MTCATDFIAQKRYQRSEAKRLMCIVLLCDALMRQMRVARNQWQRLDLPVRLSLHAKHMVNAGKSNTRLKGGMCTVIDAHLSGRIDEEDQGVLADVHVGLGPLEIGVEIATNGRIIIESTTMFQVSATTYNLIADQIADLRIDPDIAASEILRGVTDALDIPVGPFGRRTH